MASSEELTVLATIRDELSGGLAKIGAEVEAVSKKIDAQGVKVKGHAKAMTGLQAAVNDGAKAFDNLSKVVGGPLSGRLSSLSSSLTALGQTKAVGVLGALGDAGKKLDKSLDLHQRMSSMSSDLGGLVADAGKASLGFVALGAAVAAFGVKSLAGFQQTQLGLQTLTGSKAVGNQLFGQITAQTGLFSTQTLGQQAVSMLNQGTPAAGVDRRLRSLQDIASVQVDPTAALSSLVAGVNSMQHTGRVTSQGLDSLAAAGLPFYDILSKQYGISKLQVQALVDQNRIPVQSLLNQIDYQQGGLSMYRGDAKKVSTTTLSGQFASLKNNAVTQLASATSPLAGAISAQMPALSKLVSSLINTIAPAGVSILGSLIGPLANQLPKALAQLQPILPSIEKSMGGFAAALVTMLPDLMKLAADVLPILPAMVNLAADTLPVLDVFAKLVDRSGPLKDVLAGVFLGLLAFNKLAGAVTAIRGMAAAFGVLAEKLGLVAAAETKVAGGEAAIAGGGAMKFLGPVAALAFGAYEWGKSYGGQFSDTPSTGQRKSESAWLSKLHATNPAQAAAIKKAQGLISGGDPEGGRLGWDSGLAKVGLPTPVMGGPGGSYGQVVVNQTIHITGTNLTHDQLTHAVAVGARNAFERGASSTAATPTTYALGKTGS